MSGPKYFKPPAPPMCPGHGVAAKQLTTRKPGPNIGRPFWVCSKPRDNQCKVTCFRGASNQSAIQLMHCLQFFEWADEPSKKRARPASSKSKSGAQYSAPGQKTGPKMKLELYSASSFSIRVATPIDGTFFNGKMVTLIQRMNIVQHSDLEYKCGITRYDEFVKETKELGYNVSPIPKEVLTTLKDAMMIEQKLSLEEAGELVLKKLPDSLYAQLYPFQRTAVAFGVQRQGRLILGDEMGLGKTISALSLAVYFKSMPILVIVPSSVKMNWRNEIVQFCDAALLNGRGSDRIQIYETGKDKYDDKDVTIISYSLAETLRDTLATCAFGTIIADESHSLKNPKAKRTKALVPLLKAAKRCILLSGTPALSRPAELFPQLQALKCSIFRSFSAFGKRYCAGVQKTFGWDFSGSSNTEELSLLLKTAVMIRRTKKEILKDLPVKRRRCISLQGVSQNSEQAEVLGDLTNEVRKRGGVGPDGQLKLSSRGREKLMQLYVDTATLKVKPVLEYISKMLDAGTKFLVFAHHQVMMDALDDHAETHGIDFIRIDGKTSSKQRERLVERFQKKPHCQLALLSMTAAGQGITLTAAHTVVFAELHWTPGTLLQCEDRVHRIGQVSEVDIIFLIGKDSMDEQILWPMISKKLVVLESTIGGHTDATSDFNTTSGTKFQPLTIETMFSRQSSAPPPKRRATVPPGSHKISSFFPVSSAPSPPPAATAPRSFFKTAEAPSVAPRRSSVVITLSSSEEDIEEDDEDDDIFLQDHLDKKPKLAIVKDSAAETSSSPAVLSFRPKKVCIYGNKCYRKNPKHFQDFDHPKE